MEKKLSKALVMSTDIPSAISSLIQATVENTTGTDGSLPPMALRLEGQLLLGIVRIFTRKLRYLLEDCAEAVSRLNILPSPIKPPSLNSNEASRKKEAITIKAEPSNTQDLLADLVEMWKAPSVSFEFPFNMMVEEPRKEFNTTRGFDVFSSPIKEQTMEAVPLESLFPPTPAKENTFFVNPKLSLDQTLFGASSMPSEDHLLSQVEVARKSQAASSPLIEPSMGLPSLIKESPVFEAEQIFNEEGIELPQLSPFQSTQATPIKGIHESDDSLTTATIPIPSPIEATRILGSPNGISEVAKILAFNAENTNTIKTRSRKRHKAAYYDPRIEKKTQITAYMDPITELSSSEIQAQLGTNREGTLVSMEVLCCGEKLPVFDVCEKEIAVLVQIIKQDIAFQKFARNSMEIPEETIPGNNLLDTNGVWNIHYDKRKESPLELEMPDGIHEELISEQQDINSINSSMKINEGGAAFVPEYPFNSHGDQNMSDVNTEDSFEILQILNATTAKSLFLDEILSQKTMSPSRRMVASDFYQTLRLACKGAVKVYQQEPFGPITLSL